jgi:hypothetical protein
MRDRGAIQQLPLRKEKTAGNGIRGRSRRQELRLGSVKTLYETRGQTHELKVVKRGGGTAIRLPKINVRTLPRVRPLPDCKKKLRME